MLFINFIPSLSPSIKTAVDTAYASIELSAINVTLRTSQSEG